jgi:hypothetical protein
VSFTYDSAAEGPARLQLRSIDLRDYPPDRPGRISRFFADRPALRGLTDLGRSQLAQVIGDEAMNLVERHFTGAVHAARAELRDAFVPGEQILLDRHVAELRRSAADVLNDAAGRRPLPEHVADLLAYHEVLTETIDECDRLAEEATPIAEDLRRRARILRDVALSVEAAFAWINTHVPVLFAYYQSFLLWRARGVFLTVAAGVDGLADGLDALGRGYRATSERVNTMLGAFEDEAGDPHRYADELIARSRRPRR